MLSSAFSSRLRSRGTAAAALLLVAIGISYLALILYSRIDEHVFPGDEIAPSLGIAIPGTPIDFGVDVALPGVAESVKSKPWTADSRLNILVLGLDRRPWEPKDGSYRSDTMFVASIDKKFGRMQLLAIPRDTWAEIPWRAEPNEIWVEEKINTAYAYGQSQNLPGGGPEAAVAAIERNYSIDIHHHVIIDWVGFTDLIDAIGGVDVEVSEPISDFGTDVLAMFPNNTVEPGTHHMNGEEALGYSRVRTDGDLKRIERQQLVIKAVARRAVSFGYIARLPEMWDAYKDAIETDVINSQIPGFALLARGIDLENIETFSIGPALYPGISEAGAAILLPTWDQVYGIIDDFFADPRLRDEHPHIAIEYPAGLEARAQAVVDHLFVYGVPGAMVETVELPEGANGDPGIYNLTDKSYTAEKMTDLTNLRLRDADGEAPDGIDVVLRIGEDLELETP